MKIFAFLALSLAALGCAHANQATGCDFIPSGTAGMDGMNRATLLRTGEYQKLEADFDKLLIDVRQGRQVDLQIARAVQELLLLSTPVVGPITDWVEKNPNSFFAQLTNGYHYANQASLARGTGFTSQTSGQKLGAMEALHKTADQHLQAAHKIQPASGLPYVALVSIAARQEGSDSAFKQLKAANSADPKGLAARVAAMSYLAPRWGGSFELMDAAIHDSAALPAPQLDYLKYNAILERASHFEVIEKDKKAAYPLFKQALGMCGNSPSAQNGMARTVR